MGITVVQPDAQKRRAVNKALAGHMAQLLIEDPAAPAAGSVGGAPLAPSGTKWPRVLPDT